MKDLSIITDTDKFLAAAEDYGQYKYICLADKATEIENLMHCSRYFYVCKLDPEDKWRQVLNPNRITEIKLNHCAKYYPGLMFYSDCDPSIQNRGYDKERAFYEERKAFYRSLKIDEEEI